MNELSAEITQLFKEEKYDEIVKKEKEVEEIKTLLKECKDKLVKPKDECDFSKEFEKIKEQAKKSLYKSLKKVAKTSGPDPHRYWRLSNLDSKEEFCGLSGVDFRTEMGKANFPLPSGKSSVAWENSSSCYKASNCFKGDGWTKSGAEDNYWYFESKN